MRMLFLAALLIPALAAAEEPGDKAVRNADGKVEVTSIYLARDGCYSAGTSAPGTPAGVIAVENAVSITQQLKHSGAQACVMMMTPVKFTTTVEIPKGAQAIVIYTVDEHRKSVTARALAILNP